jgi:hypothetical protein
MEDVCETDEMLLEGDSLISNYLGLNLGDGTWRGDT